MFSKKDALENFVRKTSVSESFYNKVSDLQQATFSHELCKIFKSTYIVEQLQTAAFLDSQGADRVPIFGKCCS